MAYRYEEINHGGRKIYRRIPENAIEVKESTGVCYVSRDDSRSSLPYLVMAYAGKAAKTSFYRAFKSMVEVDQAICEFFDGLAARAERRSNRRKESFAPHTFKVGDVVTNSWGYDQTNVDWYRVTKVTAHYVWLQEISADVNETGFMSGSSVPAINMNGDDPTKWTFQDKKSAPTMHKASGSNVCMEFGSGSKWDGREKYASWYA